MSHGKLAEIVLEYIEFPVNGPLAKDANVDNPQVKNR